MRAPFERLGARAADWAVRQVERHGAYVAGGVLLLAAFALVVACFLLAAIFGEVAGRCT